MNDKNEELLGNCLSPELVQQVIDRCCDVLETSLSPQSLDIHGLAWGVVQRAVLKAKQEAIAVVVTVVDAGGHVVMTYRMSDALLVSTDMAYKKAYTAVGMRMTTKDLAPLTQPGQWLYQLENMTDHKIVSLAGGIPIFRGKQLLGGIGVSGGNNDQDHCIAAYALQGGEELISEMESLCPKFLR